MSDEKALLLSVKQVSILLGMSVSNVYRFMKDDSFPSPVKTGRGTRFYTAEIESWVADRRNAAGGIGSPPSCAKKPLSGREHGFTARHDFFAAAALTGILAAADNAPGAWIGKEQPLANIAHSIAAAMVSAIK